MVMKASWTKFVQYMQLTLIFLYLSVLDFISYSSFFNLYCFPSYAFLTIPIFSTSIPSSMLPSLPVSLYLYPFPPTYLPLSLHVGNNFPKPSLRLSLFPSYFLTVSLLHLLLSLLVSQFTFTSCYANSPPPHSINFFSLFLHMFSISSS